MIRIRFFTWKVPYKTWFDMDTRFHILGIRVFKYAMIIEDTNVSRDS